MDGSGAPPADRVEVWTVGHSTLSLDDLAAALAAASVACLADIRTVPKSRRHPQFHADFLARELPERGVEYRHMRLLGGWRRTTADSPNTAWRNKSFRGYADYALSSEFAAGLAELRDLARTARTAMMCSEALWWRCHRRLVADFLVARGDVVRHIGSDGRVTAHRLTPFAVVSANGLRVTYPGEEGARAGAPEAIAAAG